MIEVFGVIVGAAVLLSAYLARRFGKFHAPRALLLAEASEKEADRVACHAEGERMWGPRGGDPRRHVSVLREDRYRVARCSHGQSEHDHCADCEFIYSH